MEYTTFRWIYRSTRPPAAWMIDGHICVRQNCSSIISTVIQPQQNRLTRVAVMDFQPTQPMAVYSIYILVRLSPHPLAANENCIWWGNSICSIYLVARRRFYWQNGTILHMRQRVSVPKRCIFCSTDSCSHLYIVQALSRRHRIAVRRKLPKMICMKFARKWMFFLGIFIAEWIERIKWLSQLTFCRMYANMRYKRSNCRVYSSKLNSRVCDHKQKRCCLVPNWIRMAKLK